MREFLKLFVIGLGFLLMLQGCSKNGLPGLTLPSVEDGENGDDENSGDTGEEEETEPGNPVWQISDFKTTNNDAWVSTCGDVGGGSWARYVFIVDTRIKIWGIAYASEAACLSHTNGDIIETGDLALPYVASVQVGSDPSTQFNTSSGGTFVGMETDDAMVVDFIFWGRAASGRNRIVVACGAGYMDEAGGVSYSTLNGSPAKNLDFENVTTTDFGSLRFLMDRVPNFNLSDYAVVP